MKTISNFFTYMIILLSAKQIYGQTIAAGYESSLIICSDNTLTNWGGNTYGELGNGTNMGSSSPVNYPTINALKKVSTSKNGSPFSLFLKNDGTVWACGNNSYGQLGLGDTLDRLIPTQIPGLTNISEISAGNSFAAVLKSDGTIWVWGNNQNGQLATGDTLRRLSPFQIPSLTNFVDVKAGSGGSIMALRNDSTVWNWGYNIYGQLGNGTTIGSKIPLQVTTLSQIVKIENGMHSEYALKSDGNLYSWGWNAFGKLGNGNSTNISLPALTLAPPNIKDISAGPTSCLALKSDSTVWSWGWNFFGQLGLGNTINKSIPEQITTLGNIVSISANNHSLALSESGVLYTWGKNFNGQLADGGTTDSYSPITVNTFCSIFSGINSVENTLDNILVYPNPTNAIVTLTGIENESTIEIYNVLGEKVFSVQSQNTSINLNLTELENGIYFIQIQTENGNVTKKIIKQ